jgi:hypothetical protein
MNTTEYGHNHQTVIVIFDRYLAVVVSADNGSDEDLANT